VNARVEVMPKEAARPRILDVFSLTKPGITAMVVVSTAIGFLLASAGAVDWTLLGFVLAGTALMSGGAAALNMWMEREPDGLMRRTENRPLPAGRVPPWIAAAVGSALAVGGAGMLAVLASPLVAGLGVLSAGVYLFAYTPLKKVTSLNTLVGGITGALPPVMGWAAARGSVGVEAAALFLILFFWQMPHFLAIAWMHRDDYARAGYRMLVVGDVDGLTTAHQVIVQTSALILASGAPVVLGMADAAYLAAALALGAGFLYFGVRFAMSRTRGRAQALFFASIAYLPALLGALLVGAAYGG
jgi:protoheme IX farnesyltransferase